MLPQPAFPGMVPGRLRAFANGLPIDPAMKPSAVHPMPSCARSLGYAGLNPFVVLAALVRWLPATNRMAAAFVLKAYGAIHRGLAMRDHTARTTVLHIAWGVVPSPLARLAGLLAAAGRTR